MISQKEWNEWLTEEQNKEYFQEIMYQVRQQNKKKVLTPNIEDALTAFKMINIKECRLVLIADYPQGEPALSDGVLFSSLADPDPLTIKFYKQAFYEKQISFNDEDHTKDHWLAQGIFPLYRELTAPIGTKKKDNLWDAFTKAALHKILFDNSPKCFVYFGEDASFASWLEDNNPFGHTIIDDNMKKPTFRNSNVFAKIDNFMIKNNLKKIQWTKGDYYE